MESVWEIIEKWDMNRRTNLMWTTTQEEDFKDILLHVLCYPFPFFLLLLKTYLVSGYIILYLKKSDYGYFLSVLMQSLSSSHSISIVSLIYSVRIRTKFRHFDAFGLVHQKLSLSFLILTFFEFWKLGLIFS